MRTVSFLKPLSYSPATVTTMTAAATKYEVFDVPAMTNTDNKELVRPVQQYRETDYGLYMSRTAADHAKFSHLEDLVVPHWGCAPTSFHFTEGHRPGQRLYLDVGRFTARRRGRWHATDWYLDLVDTPPQPLELIDVVELFDACSAGLLQHGHRPGGGVRGDAGAGGGRRP